MGYEQEELSQDLVFDILSSPRRRYVLYYLREATEPVQLNELSGEVAAWENDCPVEDLTDQERKRVYVSLYQTHIPKLDSVDLVDYDRESGDVTLTDRAHQIDDYLSESEEVPWQQFYLGLSILSAVLLLLVWLDVGPFATIPELLVGVVITVGFAVSAMSHYLYWRANRREVPVELKRNGG